MGCWKVRTFTDTAGAAYNVQAGTQVIAGVTNDPATVTAAVGTISNGTLPGGVPALNLINALATANDAVVAYGKTVATANVALDTNKDGSVSSTEASAALTAATGDRTAISTDSTAVLSAKSDDAAKAAAASKAIVSAVTGGSAAVSAYDAAFAANKTATAAVAANATDATAASAGLDSALTASGATTTYATLETAGGATAGSFGSVSDVLTYLNDSATTATQRAALVTELNKVPTYGAGVVKTADLAAAATKAGAALTDAQTKLLAIDTDSATVGTQSTDYITKTTAASTAADALTKAQAADVKVAAVQTIVDQYKALGQNVANAQKAITDFETANSTKVDIQGLATGAVNATGDTAKSDVFFFTNKVATDSDGTIASFGAGDSIVLGTSLTYNSGALTTGDNNKSEFFLVQKGADVQLVIETAAYGSSDAVLTGPSTADHAAVITLTGVNVADLTVSNGVISHVA